LQTGALRSAEEVSTALKKHFAEIEAVAEEARLSENALQRIAKAKKVVTPMVATITLFWHTVQAKVAALDLTPAVEQAVHQYLLPAIYWHLVSEKMEQAKQRHTLLNRSEDRLAWLRLKDGPWRGLQPAELSLLKRWLRNAPTCFSPPVPALKDVTGNWLFITTGSIPSASESWPH
jgi:hypothetical protein